MSKSYRELVCEALDRLAKEHGQETFVSDGYGYYEDAQHEFIPMLRQVERETLDRVVSILDSHAQKSNSPEGVVLLGRMLILITQSIQETKAGAGSAAGGRPEPRLNENSESPLNGTATGLNPAASKVSQTETSAPTGLMERAEFIADRLDRFYVIPAEAKSNLVADIVDVFAEAAPTAYSLMANSRGWYVLKGTEHLMGPYKEHSEAAFWKEKLETEVSRPERQKTEEEIEYGYAHPTCSEEQECGCYSHGFHECYDHNKALIEAGRIALKSSDAVQLTDKERE